MEFVTLLFLFAVALLAQATPNDSFAYYNGECGVLDNSHSSVHWGIAKSECAQVAKVDAELNAAYRKVVRSSSQSRRKALRQAQREWLAGMNRTCGISDRAVIDNEAASGCFVTEATKRAAELRFTSGRNKRGAYVRFRPIPAIRRQGVIALALMVQEHRGRKAPEDGQALLAAAARHSHLLGRALYQISADQQFISA